MVNQYVQPCVLSQGLGLVPGTGCARTSCGCSSCMFVLEQHLAQWLGMLTAVKPVIRSNRTTTVVHVLLPGW
jgi:hypothetical protein